jgi:hypothetical protein
VVRRSVKVLGRWGMVWFVLLCVVLPRRNESGVGTWKDRDDRRRTGADVGVSLSGGGIVGGSMRGWEWMRKSRRHGPEEGRGGGSCG